MKFLLKQLQPLDKTTERSKVLELGSGTGKFTQVMLEVLKDQNVRVIASDPVDQMCEQFKRLQPDVDVIQRRTYVSWPFHDMAEGHDHFCYY